MAQFDLNKYQLVEDRIRAFWDKYPEGRILTSIYAISDTGGIFHAEVYRDKDDTMPAASDYAEEVKGSSPVNRTSWVENGLTSAVGRALANLGFSPKGARPSRQEMEKVQRLESKTVVSSWSAKIDALTSKAEARELYKAAQKSAPSDVLAAITLRADALPE